jgi:hypothetical protein
LPIAADLGLIRVLTSRTETIRDFESAAAGANASGLRVVAGSPAGILVSPSGVVSGDNHVLSQLLPAANVSPVSNEVALNAVLADCTWDSDFVNAVGHLLEKGLSDSLLSDSRLPSIYDLDDFWTTIAGGPWNHNPLTSKETM